MLRSMGANTDYVPNLMDVESPLHISEQDTPVVDNTVFVASPFPEEQEILARDEMDAEMLPDHCPLCASLDDQDDTATAELAASIVEFESSNFGKIPDETLFEQIATAYNERVVVPAETLAALCAGAGLVLNAISCCAN